MENESSGDVPNSEGRQDLADRIRSIVADGGDIRENIADAVRQAVAMVQETGESLGEVSKTVMDEALGAANEEAGSGTVLREVIDGVGDGIGSAAQAVDLAVAEARSKGQTFAEEDLHATAEDLRGLGELLVETTKRALTGAGSFVKDQTGELTSHAERAAQRMKPGLESAASAAAGDLGETLKQATRAGVSAARQGGGTLLAMMGEMITKGGESLKPGDPEQGGKPADSGEAD